ncbi:MAG: 2Fe-2S iron-sulfur cluster binding domain-containing protein [Gammaproteobacteria bacterium]|nr:2Fe-2S iron-sulfur cluster binding domain-containing protein [Gammaproteobacteria bacterium]
MVKILFVENNGTEHPVEAEVGESVMLAAVDNSVPGIDADCGGFCSCATCHVYVNPEWQQKVGPAGPAEDEMLNLTPDRKDSSRLSCQIEITQELDGLVVTTPEFQY